VYTVGYSRVSISVAKQSHAWLRKHTSDGSAVASNKPSDISEQATEGSEDDPVSQRSQSSSDEHERGLQIVRNLFDGCCLWQAESSLNTYCQYQQFALWISVLDIICWYRQLVLLRLHNSDIDNWNCRTLWIATIGIVDITNTDCRYQQLVLLRSGIADNTWTQ